MNKSENESPPDHDDPQPPADRRLYVVDGDWSVAVNRGSVARYCFSKHVGEDYFHLILDGEVYLRNGDESLCLNCALRHGQLSTNRLFSQRRPPTRRAPL